jgi:glycosyltransferase involved in cell wall biosynthesis
VSVLDVDAGREIVPAADAEAYVREVGALLDDPARARAVGVAARQRVLRSYAWGAHLSAIDRHLAGLGASPAPLAGTVMHQEAAA